MSLARDYRPKGLDEYLGEQIKATMFTRLANEKNFPQTMLLQGPRGCGKTSLARLIAKEYMCLDRQNGRACGKCEMCLEMQDTVILAEAGVSTGVIQEVDIAADGGKARIEEVLNEALYPPMEPMKYKIVILDEFHRASKGVQNQLLKIMEEPPKHLVFILCTTNPEEILETILSRCQMKVQIKKAEADELVRRLLYICEKEGIKVSEQALEAIVKKTERVPREAITMLEDIAASNSNVVDILAVKKQFGEVESEKFIGMFEVANTGLEQIMVFVKELKDENMEMKKFVYGLGRFVLDSINVRYGIGIEQYPIEFIKQVKKLFKIYTASEMDTLLQIVEHAMKIVDSDDTKGELLVVTTALRIGKIGALANGLYAQDKQAEVENKASLIAYHSILKEEEEETRNIKVQEIDTELLASALGKDVVSVTVDADTVIAHSKKKRAEIPEEDPSGNRLLSDDELLDMFNDL